MSCRYRSCYIINIVTQRHVEYTIFIQAEVTHRIMRGLSTSIFHKSLDTFLFIGSYMLINCTLGLVTFTKQSTLKNVADSRPFQRHKDGLAFPHPHHNSSLILVKLRRELGQLHQHSPKREAPG